MNEHKQVIIESTDIYFARSALGARIDFYKAAIAREKANPYSAEREERIHSLCYWLRGYERVAKALQNATSISTAEQMRMETKKKDEGG